LSPAQVLERTYATLKERLLSGLYAPGYRLEAVRLADDLSVSMTPVRDVLNRLTGERLVHAVAGDGFYVPVMTEDALRDLLTWNAHLLDRAVRRRPRAERVGRGLPAAGSDLADRTGILFLMMARDTDSAEFEQAVASVNDRLHVVRRREPLVLRQAEAELQGLEQAYRNESVRDLARQLRSYHARRLRQVSSLLRRPREGGEA
jgi:DNA-binding transcriptional regulator YhcF (GntR family)